MNTAFRVGSRICMSSRDCADFPFRCLLANVTRAKRFVAPRGAGATRTTWLKPSNVPKLLSSARPLKSRVRNRLLGPTNALPQLSLPRGPFTTFRISPAGSASRTPARQLHLGAGDRGFKSYRRDQSLVKLLRSLCSAALAVGLLAGIRWTTKNDDFRAAMTPT